MPISNIINPRCYRNFSQACLLYFPDWLVRYAALHLDTIPKFLNHVLVLMGICNCLCILNAFTISFFSFLAAFLLGFQNASLLLILNNGKLVFSPRFLAPTEFMIGVCLGISIGGTILSFFLCLTYGMFHSFCEHHDKDEYSCRGMKGAINGVWWWSSVVFWLDLLTCLLVAAGRHEITDNSMSQYQSIDNDGMSMDQYEDHFQRFKENQQQQQQLPNNNNGGEAAPFLGNYNNVPDVVHPQQSQSPQAQPPQFAQQPSSSASSHQSSRPRQAQDPLLV